MRPRARHSLGAAAILAIVPLAACDSPPPYQSAERQFGLSLEELAGQIVDAPADEAHVVEQSRMCPIFEGWFDTDGFHIRGQQEDDAWLRECIELGASGQARIEGGCLVVEAPGASALELGAVPCDVSSFVDDRLPVIGHAVADLSLVYDDPAIRSIRDSLHPGPASSFPLPPTPTPGEPIRVIAGSARPFALQPVHASDARPVAFSGASVTADVGSPADYGDGAATLTIAAGDTVTLSLVLPAGTIEGEPILGVPASDAATIELLVGYAPCDACDDGYAQPIVAAVVVRDAEGRRLRSPDVEWDVSGDALPLGDMIEPGATRLEPDCADAEGDERSSTLSVTFESLSASAEIAYTCPEPGQVEQWEVDIIDDDNPESGCLCSADSSANGGFAWLLLVPLAARRARARRPTTSRPARSSSDPR